MFVRIICSKEKLMLTCILRDRVDKKFQTVEEERASSQDEPP